MSPSTDVTVAICTWNRARLLDTTLAQMCNVRIPPGLTWELLVVDNNCTDDTPDVVARYADRLPVRRLVEPRQGVAHARNLMLKAAAGSLLLIVDDDVLVDPEWLGEYVSAAKRWPDASFFGGLVTPWFEREPPDWFRANLDMLSSLIAARDLGPEERPLGTEEWPFGANMALRRTAFETTAFETRLGSRGNDQVRGEEIEYCRALARKGFHGVWVPSAKVQHFVVAERLTLEYVRAYWVGVGRTEVRLAGKVEPSVPRWVYRVLLANHARYLWHRAIGHPDWMKSLKEAWRMRGVWAEHRKQRAGPTFDGET